MKAKSIKDINGNNVTIDVKIIKEESKSSIKFWTEMKKDPEWKSEATKNLKYWRYLYNQVKNK